MPVTVIVGMQWGDEGKAKVLDFLAADADMIVRYQGGANAGHTVVIGGDRFAFHLVPSGILREGKTCVVGNGVVVDAAELLAELEALRARGVDATGRLMISDRAHLVLPYHKLVEKAQEETRGAHKIGTTLRGIGPCYVEKAGRTGVRTADLLDAGMLLGKVRAAWERCRPLCPDAPAPEEVTAELADLGRRLAPYIIDTVYLLNEACRQGKRLLFEGAQGTLLDVDFGTYPFVTSSNSSACGVGAGSGLSPRLIDRVIGVVKAYTTRVGGGPFPTEMQGEVGERVRERGREYGTTTGRPRRCGWLDAVGLRYAALLNAVDAIALTKLDVLSGVQPLRIARAYRIGGRQTEQFPARPEDLAAAEPVYEELAGWDADISHARSMQQLPAECVRYVAAVEDIAGARVSLVSVGHDRAASIVMDKT